MATFIVIWMVLEKANLPLSYIPGKSVIIVKASKNMAN